MRTDKHLPDYAFFNFVQTFNNNDKNTADDELEVCSMGRNVLPFTALGWRTEELRGRAVHHVCETLDICKTKCLLISVGS